MVIGQINNGLSEGDKFWEGEKLRIFAWSGEYSVAFIFKELDDCERFYKRAGAPEVRGRFSWSDPLFVGGPKLLRVNKDASFDQCLRTQVFYNLRQEIVEHLVKMESGSLRTWRSLIVVLRGLCSSRLARRSTISSGWM